MGLRTHILLMHVLLVQSIPVQSSPVQSSFYRMTPHSYSEGIQVHILGDAFVGSGTRSIIL